MNSNDWDDKLALGLKHSKKLEDFARVIEALYPNPPLIELFARTRRDGWDSWGDEVTC